MANCGQQKTHTACTTDQQQNYTNSSEDIERGPQQTHASNETTAINTLA